MLSAARNAMLTQTGRGTPMGELLRRYWHPIAAADQFASNAVRAVRLMGEELVLYKDLSGKYGLVERRCPHRRADLSYGFVEECGIRCNYHGWQFDETGACVSQPYEDIANPDARFREKISIMAYPVEEKGGLLWAYLGPKPAPQCPDWEAFNWQNGFRQIVFATVPCNWVQAQENSIDPVHFEWMHGNWSVRLDGKTRPYVATHLKVDFDEFEFGFVYKRVTEAQDERSPLWTVGRVCLYPNGFYLGDHFEWRVPIDDATMLSVFWGFTPIPIERRPYVQNVIPSWESPIKDEKTGRWIASHVINQDIIAWVGQGAIADRTKEHLGASDRGVSMLRKQWFDDIDRMQRGEDPKGLIRDATRNRNVQLPNARNDHNLSFTIDQMKTDPVLSRGLKDFTFHYGQPPEVRRAFEQAVGLR
jgi:5,5'-dehydrodivanillate O-demethylase